MKRKLIQIKIEGLMERFGLTDAFWNDQHFHAKFIAGSESIMPLVVESWTDPNMGRMVSIAHYFEMNGDLVQDPEIVFRVADEVWTATEITLAPPFGYERLMWFDGGKWYHRPKGIKDAHSFAVTWARNIGAQFKDCTVEGDSVPENGTQPEPNIEEDEPITNPYLKRKRELRDQFVKLLMDKAEHTFRPEHVETQNPDAIRGEALGLLLADWLFDSGEIARVVLIALGCAMEDLNHHISAARFRAATPEDLFAAFRDIVSS